LKQPKIFKKEAENEDRRGKIIPKDDFTAPPQ